MVQDYRKILADNIKKYRLLSKMSKEALSLTLGFDNSYISKVENERVNITIDRIAKIADYFAIDIKELFLK